MRRKVLLISVLLLFLILLSTTPAIAKRPPPKGEKERVVFSDSLSGTGYLYVDEKGRNIAVYGYMPMTINVENYPHNGDKPDFGLRLTLEGMETGEVELGSGFDLIEWTFFDGCVKKLELHNFGGSGTYSIVNGIYEVTLEDASFGVLVDAHTNKKCAGYGLEYDETPWSDIITFTVEIVGD